MSAYKKCLTFLDVIVFLGLLGLAMVFIWQAWVQFESEDSSFKRSETLLKEIPTITFCLRPVNMTFEDWGPPYSFTIGEDFQIEYLYDISAWATNGGYSAFQRSNT